MPLPEFDSRGDLPVGIHLATIEEVTTRFGSGTLRRQAVTANLLCIYHLARTTGKVDRFLLFGSYITAKPEPNDVDIVLIMEDDFRVTNLELEVQQLFDHQQATATLGASLFWARPSMLLEPLGTFIAHWQIKRDQTRRGIVEVEI